MPQSSINKYCHNPVSTNIVTIQYRKILPQSSINKYCHNPVSTNIATIQYQQILPQSSINKYCHNPVSTNIATIHYQQILPFNFTSNKTNLSDRRCCVWPSTDNNPFWYDIFTYAPVRYSTFHIWSSFQFRFKRSSNLDEESTRVRRSVGKY